MIYTGKYRGHTPAGEWRLAFMEVNNHLSKEILGLQVRAYHLGQMQACDYEDYLVAQANQNLARDAPLLLAEVERLREQQKKILEIAETNMALEWSDTDASIEWGAVADIIKGWIE